MIAKKNVMPKSFHGAFVLQESNKCSYETKWSYADRKTIFKVFCVKEA